MVWTGTLFQLACEQLYQMCLTSGRHDGSSVPEPLLARLPDADSIFTTLAAASCGPIWDMATDSHMHWLDSWSRLSTGQRPVTEWCPLQLLQSLPEGLEWINKSESSVARAIKLKANDKR